MSKLISVIILYLLFCGSLFGEERDHPSFEKPEIRIGVLAFRPEPITREEWKPLCDYLTHQIPSHTFTVLPLSYKGLNEAVAHKRVDFVVTNPDHYILLSSQYGITRMATLVRDTVDKNPLKEFGGVIVTRADQKNISQVEDIKGKRIVAVSPQSLAGYLAQASLLLDKGIDISVGHKILFTDMPHDKAIFELREGHADVAFVRSGVLEAMAKDGKIILSHFRVLHLLSPPKYPYMVSTPLYPEWPISSLPHTDADLAKRVAIILLSLPHGSEITKKAGYSGWDIPLSYEGVRETMMRLRVPPFDEEQEINVRDILSKFGLEVVGGLTLILLLMGALIIALIRTTHKLTQGSQELEVLLSEQKSVEKYLRQAASVFHNAGEAIIITDKDKVILDVNDTFSLLTGYPKDEVVGKTPKILRSGLHDEEFYTQMDRALEAEGKWRGEIWNKKKGGEKIAELLTINVVKNNEGGIDGYIGLFSDITRMKETQEHLAHMANFDPLTNLPNRRLFSSIAQQVLAYAKRKEERAAVVFIDLDRFKQVNDERGHDVGDWVLQEVVGRCKRCIRSSDTLARFGGDEFVLLLTSIGTNEEVATLLETMVNAICEPYIYQGVDFSLGASVGVAIYPEDDTSLETLIRYADSAMYKSKFMGKNKVIFYKNEEY